MGGISDLLIVVEDAVNEIHSREPRPSYKQAIKELKKEKFESRRTGMSFTLGKETKDYMDAVLENKGHEWDGDWSEADSEAEEEAIDDVGASNEGTPAESGKKRLRPEDEAQTAGELPNEPLGVTRQRQRNATYTPDMRAVLSRIGVAIHEALSCHDGGGGVAVAHGCSALPQGAPLELRGVSLGAWEALVAHLLGPGVQTHEQEIELRRYELMDYFEKAHLAALHCIPGTSRRVICTDASFGWKPEPPRGLPMDQLMSYGFEPEHQGRLTITITMVLHGA